MPFYILFIIFPLMELWVFVEACGEIGFFTSFFLLIFAAVAGTSLIRHQGFQTLVAMHDAADRRRMPLDSLFDAFCVVAAGILLIIPGFISDVVAILLLIPRARLLLRSYFKQHPKWTTATDGGILEGEFERVEEPGPSLKGPPSERD